MSENKVLPFEATHSSPNDNQTQTTTRKQVKDIDRLAIASPYTIFPYWWTPYGFYIRCTRSKFIRYFSCVDGGEVTVADMDALVSLFSLIAAFVLSVPFGVMTSLQNDALQSLKDAAAACPSLDNFQFSSAYLSHRQVLVQAVYAPLISIVLSLVYYVLRPGELHVEEEPETAAEGRQETENNNDKDTLENEKEQISHSNTKHTNPNSNNNNGVVSVTEEMHVKRHRVFRFGFKSKNSNNKQQRISQKLFVNEAYIAAVNDDFRDWWYRGKWIVFFITAGTIYSIVILCFVFTIYYTSMLVPADYVCSREIHQSLNDQSSIGWMVLLGLFVLFVYIVV